MNTRKLAIVSIIISIVSYFLIYMDIHLLSELTDNDFIEIGLKFFPVALAFFALGLSIYGFIIIIIKKYYLSEFIIMVIAAVIALNSVFWTTLYFANIFRDSPKAVCSTNLGSLGKAIQTYVQDNKGSLPDPNKWCDLLIIFADTAPKELLCTDSDAIIGESSYAMNINLKGKKLGQVDPEIVVLFETIYGKDTNGRDVTVSSRYSYKVLKENGEDVSMFGDNPEKRKVYKNRWNQSGGPEILSAENHKGKGANILFTDSRVRWIPKEDFNNLNWGEKTNIK